MAQKMGGKQHQQQEDIILKAFCVIRRRWNMRNCSWYMPCYWRKKMDSEYRRRYTLRKLVMQSELASTAAVDLQGVASEVIKLSQTFLLCSLLPLAFVTKGFADKTLHKVEYLSSLWKA
ncbi:hypothetical protein Nepgr_025241 [Nepenthes gracilis]|uniref:Uncharacterized protein n=1 Tax=Nepenthes gracilis TaxID=150966 RepID=A0AAD3XZH8_NEPGR|nr:hypothetical protein Nepgr_025241 [Nepenthes gracilis]